MNCSNLCVRGSGLSFYTFPADLDRRNKWIAAVNRKNWYPTEHTVICSEHFIDGQKSNNQFAPNYTPTIFQRVDSPMKRKMEAQVADFRRRTASRKRRIEQTEITDQQKKKAKESRMQELAESSKRQEEARKLEEERRLKEIEEQQRLEEERKRREEDERERLLREEERREAEQRKEIEDAKQKRLDEMNRLQQAEESRLEYDELLKKYDDLLKYNQAVEELEQLRKKEAKLNTKVDELQTRIVSRQSLEENDKQVKFYTGLPSFAVLLAIYNLVIKGLPECHFSGCPMFNQLLITLIKLRLNIPDQDLAYRFGVNQSTVSRCITKWLDVLHVKLSPLIYWPERDQLRKTMPTCFRKNFRKCAIVIDCFEVFIDRPTSLMARAQTWSNYKKHNTCKFLIGITPQGSVSFISKGWGGRVSDVHLTENCGLLSKLLPGDVILADRGFTIEKAAGMYCAEVKVPPFTRGKKQLSKLEVDTARQLSHVRIHVERVIGLVRQKYSILQSTLSINMLKGDEEGVSPVDKIVVICCALCNCCDSVVPF